MLKNLFRKKYRRLINQINRLEDQVKILTNNELRNESFKLKQQYKNDQNLNALITKSFALTREASLRTLGLRHFDVQLMGGLVLNDQKIAEMRTGEGKTLVATLSASLNALTKKGVHVITVNDYLANRDQVSMGQIYRFLGFNTGLIQNAMLISEKKENYNADITYVTNSEVTFDFLRDNMALNLNDVVLRPLNYCIIDEIDSILIDEAQTPLILSNNIETSFEKYIIASEAIKYLDLNIDYKVDKKNKNITLTEKGSIKVEKLLNISNLYDPEDPWIPYIVNALQSIALYFNNVHYIIQNKRIIIVDEFTGRIMPDRRWGEGLHQAIEAKESLPIRQETETVASITYQNFFLLYKKLSGMTGTASTARKEFQNIYKLSIKKIPTAKPNQRKDLPDLIYKDQFSKWNAIATACKKISLTGQPILIGTTTIEKSEMLAQLLNEYKLSYKILNAKPENVRKESEIIAQAGQKGSITIATNMAGRGTDIILGGNIHFITQKRLYEILVFLKNYQPSKSLEILESSLLAEFSGISQKFFSVLISLRNDLKFLEVSDSDVLRILRENDRIYTPVISYQFSVRFLISELNYFNKKNQKQENQIVKNLGGLYIIGTERNDSRRIDNQLRGRCGRQGDPGISRFFLSLDDDLLRLFGSTKIQNLWQTQVWDNLPLESRFITKSLNSAQKRVEERCYEQRKSLFEYDKIINKQRNVIYTMRKEILEKESKAISDELMLDYGWVVSQDFATRLKTKKSCIKETVLAIEVLFSKQLFTNLNLWYDYGSELNSFINNIELFFLKQYLFSEFCDAYYSKIESFSVQGIDLDGTFQRTLILTNIDKIWSEHLQAMKLVREKVIWRSYGQQKPLDEYKKAAISLFKKYIKQIKHMTIYQFFLSDIILK